MEANRLEYALDECLQKLLAGGTVDQALAPYADLADELKPLLQVALAARGFAELITPPREAQARSRQRFLAAVVQADLAGQERRSARNSPEPAWKTFWNSLFALPTLARAIAVLLVVLVFGGTSSVVASAQALPGDALYPLKLAAERTRLLLTSGPAAKLELEQSFDQKRLQEMNALVQVSRSEEITFAGELSAMDPEIWTVQGVQVQIQAQTELPDTVAPGFYVEVQGLLQANGSVLAERIAVRRVELGGTIDAIENELWIVDGLQVRLNADTLLRGQPVIGQRAQVQAFRLADGNLLAFAITMESAGQGEEPVTPTQMTTATPEPTASLELTEAPEATKTPQPSATQISDGDDEDGSTPHPEETRQATRTDEPDETGEPEATEEESSDATDEPDQTEETTKTDEPDNTEEPDDPTKTPKPDDD